MANKDSLWTDFCIEHRVIERSVPLFETDERTVKTFRYGTNNRLLLRRSSKMDDLVIQEASKVVEDHKSNSGQYEGIIYMMCWHENRKVLPLYIGKSEKHGLKGTNISANIENIRRNQGKFCRWGYNYAYHVGDLSALVCPGHPNEKANLKYSRWADQLFEKASWPSEAPQLTRDVFFWAEAWKAGSVGIWREFGATPLTFLEYLLIGAASQLFPETLLNSDGVNRG
jgi:hypothetical protein